jgi:DNA-binding transcriptional LysR family regulator
MRERDGAGYALSPSGEAMARAARRIEANLSQAADDLRAISSGFQGHVRLSTVSTAQYFAPVLVRMLRDALPEIEVGLHVGNRRDVIAELDQGRTDLAVMGRPPRAPLVRAEPLGAHPHGILLPPGHRLAGQDGFDPVELLEETFLLREEGSGTRALMMRYLDRLSEGASPPTIELSSNESIKQAVIAGLGIAFLSLHTARDDLASGRLVLLRGMGLPVMRQWYLVRPTGVSPTTACDEVARAITGFAGAYFPALSGLSG